MKGFEESPGGNNIYELRADEYRLLFESTRDALIIFDPANNRSIMCNPAACELFGYSSCVDFMKMSPSDLSSENQPDGRESSHAVDEIIKRVLKEKHIEGRWVYKRKEGESFIAKVELTLINLRNKPLILANVKDITEEARIEAELRDNMFSVDAAVNGTGMGLWDWDIENDNLVLNDNWFEMLGFTRKDFKKRYEKFGYQTFADSVHPDDIIKVEEKLKSHYAREIDYYRVEVRMKTSDNQWKWILAAGKVCEWSGDKPRRMVGIHTDIDYRVKMEEKLKEAIKRAEESDKLKSAFLANMSHEIRTPMNGIIGFMDLMESPDTTEAQRKEYSEIIRNSSRRLLDIVNDLINISKIEAGQVEIHESVVNLRNFFDEMMVHYSHVIAEGVKFEIKQADNLLEENILVDQPKLQQVFSNLISNASKFTSEGEISIGYSLQGDMIEFYVKDTGEGIDPAYQDIIFDRFRQADTRPSRLKGGTGLGLSICKAYIEKLGGKIWFESKKGKGSTFYFTVPYRPVEYVKSDDKILKGKASGFKNDGVILIVEDELYNYLFAEYVLKDRGYRIIHSETGQKAIEYIRLYPEISLVIMDIRLPDISGYRVTREIKLMRPDLPVIALTALALSGDRESAMAAGCDHYLKKPITKEKLIESISYFLEGSD
jgi:PAS domain S-box-containing protein